MKCAPAEVVGSITKFDVDQPTLLVLYANNPVWSPDGKQIAFESNRDGNLEIYVLKLQ